MVFPLFHKPYHLLTFSKRMAQSPPVLFIYLSNSNADIFGVVRVNSILFLPTFLTFQPEFCNYHLNFEACNVDSFSANFELPITMITRNGLILILQSQGHDAKKLINNQWFKSVSWEYCCVEENLMKYYKGNFLKYSLILAVPHQN